MIILHQYWRGIKFQAVDGSVFEKPFDFHEVFFVCLADVTVGNFVSQPKDALIAGHRERVFDLR